jgi:hypothetical protein
VATQAAAIATFGLMTAAHALWTVNDTVLLPTVATGSVTFAARADDGARTVSAGGAPVTLTLPGARIAEVLEETGPDPQPVFWRFTASGAALGITGLVYDVRVTAQVAADGTSVDLSGGVARPGTVLAGSTLTVYPAVAGGDCSGVPAAPAPVEGEARRNVHVLAGTQHVLQEPGTNPAGEPVSQEWCVAMIWNHDSDGRYANDVHVTARGEDGTASAALAQWRAGVAFPPLLEASGTYAGRGSAAALGEDGTTSRAHSDWWAVLHPDPAGEPDVTVTLDPAITNLHPDIPTGDAFQIASP